MRAVDTNLLVRIFLMDDERQAAAVNRLLRRQGRVNEPIFVGLVVLCEFVWVLERAYGFSRADVAARLDELLETELIVLEQPDLARQAAERYRAGPGDFSDHVICLTSLAAGCRETVTFDRALRSVKGFTELR